MNKTVSIIITLGLVIGIGIIFFGDNFKKNTNINEVQENQNIEIKKGIQYITINAKGGYSPRVTSAKAGIPTKLIVATSGSYDCSVSLVIRSIDFQKILPQTGETEIDIGTKKVGEKLEGICGMGMYNFLINFN